MKTSEILENQDIARQGVFSTDELEKKFGKPRAELNLALSRLVKRGKLARIRNSLFCFEPQGAGGARRGYACNWYLVARSLASGKPYFVSHYSAMHLHGMTTESIQTIFISLPVQRQAPRSLRIPIRFVTVPQKRFWGLQEKWVTNEGKVWVTDLERTVLDSLDRPDLSGGLMEVARGIWLLRDQISAEKLVGDAKRFESYAVSKRLGFLMELLEIGSKKEREELKHSALRAKSYAVLDPTIQARPKYLHAWRLALNIGPEEIKRNLMT